MGKRLLMSNYVGISASEKLGGGLLHQKELVDTFHHYEEGYGWELGHTFSISIVTATGILVQLSMIKVANNLYHILDNKNQESACEWSWPGQQDNSLLQTIPLNIVQYIHSSENYAWPVHCK